MPDAPRQARQTGTRRGLSPDLLVRSVGSCAPRSTAGARPHRRLRRHRTRDASAPPEAHWAASRLWRCAALCARCRHARVAPPAARRGAVRRSQARPANFGAASQWNPTCTARRFRAMSENLALSLTATATEHGPRPALLSDGTAMTYAELDVASARVARLMSQRGLRCGDRVGIMLPNVPAFAVAY